MDVSTEESKTEFVGVPDRPPSALDLTHSRPGDESWDAVRPYLLAPQRIGSLGRLGHYELLEVLGQGGFGIVVKAIDEKLQRPVAIKILSPLLTGASSSPRTNILREARVAAKVQHENVVRIYGVEELPTPYIVMEYIAGQTLQNRIDAAGPLDAEEVVRLGRQIALGLAAAHAQGLIHRDIKPANILLEGDGSHVKITDFGIARTADDDGKTQNSLIVGTPMYMSPEQAGGEAIDHRSDLFSLGSVLYTMACGRPPYRAGSGLSVLKRVTQERPRPIAEINAGVPSRLCAIIARLQERNPGDRFNTAAEAADQLSACLDPAGQIPSWRRSGALLAACVLIVTFMAGFVVRERQLIGAVGPAPSPEPAASAAVPPEPKLSERDAWRQELAVLPGHEKTRLFLERFKKNNPKLNSEKVAFHVENDEIVHLALHEGVYPDLTLLNGLVNLRSLWMDSGAGVASFEPLRGLPLRYIQCVNSEVTDLSPLQGLPLDTLRIWGWKGSDLSPLRGMQLENLNVGHSDVADLSPLRGMPLKFLGLNRTKVSDLSTIAGMRLEELLMDETLVEDISVVRGMPLKNLGIRRSRVANTDPIRGLPLRVINIDYDHARDREIVASLKALELINLTPPAKFLTDFPGPAPQVLGRDVWRERLAAVSGKEKVRLLTERLQKDNPKLDAAKVDARLEGDDVVSIELPDAACSDLTVFAGFPKLRMLLLQGGYPGVKTFEPLRGLPLETIACMHSQVADLSPLEGMPLKSLCIWGWRGTDLSPLRGLPLDHLNCGLSEVNDLSPLKNLPLTYLCVNSSKVANLSPLAGMKLRELLVENTPVDDLSIVRDMPLKLLTVRKTRILDTSPLRGLPLDHLIVDYDHARDRDLIASLKSLERVNDTPLNEFLANAR